MLLAPYKCSPLCQHFISLRKDARAYEREMSMYIHNSKRRPQNGQNKQKLATAGCGNSCIAGVSRTINSSNGIILHVPEKFEITHFLLRSFYVCTSSDAWVECLSKSTLLLLQIHHPHLPVVRGGLEVRGARMTPSGPRMRFLAPHGPRWWLLARTVTYSLRRVFKSCTVYIIIYNYLYNYTLSILALYTVLWVGKNSLW